MARLERPGSSRQEQEANDVFARLIDKQNYGGVARVAHGGLVTPRDGRPAAAEGGTGVTARDEAQGEQHATGGFACTSVITGHAGHVHCMLAAKGQLFSASQDQTVRVWGLQREGFRHMAELSGHHGFVRTLAVSGGGALLFSGSQDKNIRVWDTHTHVQLCALPGHQEEVRALAVHNDLLFSGSEDSTIKVRRTALAHARHPLLTPPPHARARARRCGTSPRSSASARWAGTREKSRRRRADTRPPSSSSRCAASRRCSRRARATTPCACGISLP